MPPPARCLTSLSDLIKTTAGEIFLATLRKATPVSFRLSSPLSWAITDEGFVIPVPKAIIKAQAINVETSFQRIAITP